ncbi:hypothetical protein BH20BAC1_BH20BAC1_11780 [soil metagenome]
MFPDILTRYFSRWNLLRNNEQYWREVSLSRVLFNELVSDISPVIHAIKMDLVKYFL